ncbi:hypothetical protein GCM10027610_105230 [Dactylosporangium cerinum]
MVVAAPGHAARIAASTAPGGTVPGTHTVIRSCRPVHVYCHTTCGDPYSSRRRLEGVRTPCRFAHSAPAACSSTSGGGAMVTRRAPAAWRVCRHPARRFRAATQATRTAAATASSHGRPPAQ